MMPGGGCITCCGPMPPFCAPCGPNLPPANLSFEPTPKRVKGLPPPKQSGPCKMLNVPLGPKPDTILMPIYIDEANIKPRKKHHGNKQSPCERKEGPCKKTAAPKFFRKRAKSRELRGGILYMGCDCEKRNGLQDDCRRTGCQGSPECLTNPPICGPSAYSSGKHLVKMAEAWKAKHKVV